MMVAEGLEWLEEKESLSIQLYKNLQQNIRSQW